MRKVNAGIFSVLVFISSAEALPNSQNCCISKNHNAEAVDRQAGLYSAGAWIYRCSRWFFVKLLEYQTINNVITEAGKQLKSSEGNSPSTESQNDVNGKLRKLREETASWLAQIDAEQKRRDSELKSRGESLDRVSPRRLCKNCSAQRN